MPTTKMQNQSEDNNTESNKRKRTTRGKLDIPTNIQNPTTRTKVTQPQNLRRIKKELVLILQSNYTEFSVAPDQTDLTKWIASLQGPKDCSYENGTFYLSIEFRENYPFQPPRIKFQTKIYHCNISHKGDICLDILKKNWSPALSMIQIFFSILLLLQEPNPNDPLEPELAKHLKTDPDGYYNTAKEWTAKFAHP